LDGEVHVTDIEFNAFVALSVESLARKQAALAKKYQLGTHARWHHDQSTGMLQFFDSKDQVRVEASVIELGSFSTRSQTWRWAWANASILEKEQAGSAKLRELFETTGVEIFRMESFEADEQMAWEIAAMAVAHLAAPGCYRSPASHLHVYLAIERIRSVAAGP
jgi:hypothetical protein